MALKYKTYTFDSLIKKVLEFCVDDYVPRIRSICNWKIQSSENFLLALLLNRQDYIAQDFVKFYLKDATPELMVFCLRNVNENFLKFALGESIFGVNYFEKEEVR
jgi:hypothetical protein